MLLEKESKKYELEVLSQKRRLIQEIKKINKEDILPKPPKQLTLWERIKKVLMG
jgi:hypothetical protein